MILFTMESDGSSQLAPNIIFKMFHEGKKYLEKVRDMMWSQTDGFAAWGIPTSEAELESEIKAVFLKTLDSHEAQE